MSNLNAPSLTGTIVDSYIVDSFLRHEVYGPVYLGKHQQTHQQVRLHFLQSQDGKPLSHDRFRNGLYGVKNLNSPYLNPIDGFGQFKEFFYIAYHHTNLKSLQEVINESSPSSSPQTFGTLHFDQLKKWMNELHQALITLHGSRVYHHGLSLDCLWINDSGSLLLSHHGLAVVFKKRMTALSNSAQLDDPLLLSRASYVSPEEIRGRLLDQSTDLYSTSIYVINFL
jgi:serine/threonine protein kinase